MLGGRVGAGGGTQPITCGLCADSVSESELNVIVEHSVGVRRVRELAGGVRKYHRPHKKRERWMADRTRLDGAVHSSHCGGERFDLFFGILNKWKSYQKEDNLEGIFWQQLWTGVRVSHWRDPVVVSLCAKKCHATRAVFGKQDWGG